jgi:DNA topoisomerase VI subunit B
MTQAVDLESFTEEQRVAAIRVAVVELRKTVGVILERDESKIERYIAKVINPGGVSVLDRINGPTPRTVTIKFAPTALN